ncbi:hypothetical protein [Pseudomonas sp. RIT-PI-S]|uniref:hypothetical protein n=1 Tax=Pseudomonas sp. RIT-PI-S TaxID=3035295 RepID=UPI0021D8F767|nr:hypothetical protein [Pseudomonas sp. RIT-PI-S]
MTFSAPHDPHSTMQGIALAFLQSHRNTHPGCDQALFSRTAAHLQHDHGVEAEQAHVIAGRAYGEFRRADGRYRLDLANSTDSLAVLTDSASGLTYMVPVAAIVRLILAAPGRRHLRLVN